MYSLMLLRFFLDSKGSKRALRKTKSVSACRVTMLNVHPYRLGMKKMALNLSDPQQISA